MKPHLSKRLIAALLAAIITFPNAYATEISDAALFMADFSEASISAANSLGWMFDNVTPTSGGTFVSTTSRAVIHSDHDWATRGDCAPGYRYDYRVLWSGIIQINCESLLKAGGSGILFQSTNNVIYGTAGEGAGFSNDQLVGVWQDDVYPSLTLTERNLSQCADEQGNITIGIQYLGDGGTTLYIVDSQENVYSKNGYTLKSGVDDPDLAMDMLFTSTPGIEYVSLYLFGDTVDSESMINMLQGLVPFTESKKYTWNARGTERAVWDTATENWTNSGTASTYTSDLTSVAIFNEGDYAKEVQVDNNILAGKVQVNDDYTFCLAADITLSTTELVISDGNTMVLKGEGMLKISRGNNGGGWLALEGCEVDLSGNAISGDFNVTGTGSIGNGRINGNLTVDNATLTIDEDLTLGGNLLIENENCIVVADGATLYLTHTITNENYIELAGKIDISAITGTATGSSYVGGEIKGNGYLQTGYEMILIDCGLSGDFKWSEAEIYHSGNEVTKEDWGGVSYSVTDASNFYIFNGTESVSTARCLGANTCINLSSGATLNVDEDVNMSQIQVNGAAGIDIEEGKTLSGYYSGYNLTLSGTGAYELDSRTSLGSLVLGSDWTGTVRLMGSANSVNFNTMARTDSWLELKGFSGYPTTYNGTTSINIILTDKEDGTAAFTATYGYSYDYGYTMKFTGTIKGEGTFVANATSNSYENYEFAGDIQDWSGKFRYVTGRKTKLTISGNAHVVNAGIDGADGLTLCVNTNAIFNEAASVYGLTLNNSSVTFNDSIQVNSNVSASGTSSLTISDGQALSLGSVISNSGNLTLSGTFDVSGHTSVLLACEYSGGATSGNGYGLTLYGVQVVQNSGSATLDWSAADVIYDTPGYEKRADGFIVQEFNDGQFHVMTGTERVSTAQDAAEEAGITMQGVELKNGTTLIVDKEFSTAHVSLVSGSALLDVEAGVTLLSDGADHTGLSLSGNGMYRLAAESSTPDIDWSGNDWHGTVMLSDAVKQDWNLNDFGNAGSKVGLNGVSGNFARPNACSEIVPTLVLIDDGLTVTACYTNATYTFSGGVEGDGNWTYGLTGNPHNQTYIFTGNVSKWTGAYESIVEGKTSTLKFYGDAVEMGAAIKATAGTVNVEVGNGTDAFATTFGNDITASSLKVLDKAAATLTKDTTIAGKIEVAGSLKIQGVGQLNVGDAVRMGAVDESTPATLAGVDISSAELSARGEDKAELTGVSITTMDDFKLENVRLDGSFIDIGEDTTFYIKNVEISADTRITDGAARMFIEGGKAFLDESNTEASAPTMSLSDVTFYRSGDTETWVTLHENVSLVSLTSEVFTKVMLTGTDLWLDLTGLSAQVGDATAFSVSFEDGALFDVDSLRVYATLNGEKYLDGYTTQQSGGATTLYFSAQIPEPTTSTLSLLALAALAARRKKK